MKLKEISKDIYDVDAWLDESLGKEGTREREKNRERAWEEYNAQILLDARKNAAYCSYSCNIIQNSFCYGIDDRT